MSAAGAVSDRAYSPRFDGIAICSNVLKLKARPLLLGPRQPLPAVEEK